MLLCASKFAKGKIECSFEKGQGNTFGGTIYFAVYGTWQFSEYASTKNNNPMKGIQNALIKHTSRTSKIGCNLREFECIQLFIAGLQKLVMSKRFIK